MLNVYLPNPVARFRRLCHCRAWLVTRIHQTPNLKKSVVVVSNAKNTDDDTDISDYNREVHYHERKVRQGVFVPFQ